MEVWSHCLKYHNKPYHSDMSLWTFTTLNWLSYIVNRQSGMLYLSTLRLVQIGQILICGHSLEAVSSYYIIFMFTNCSHAP